jgi:2-amino-4-hydroxy-6-hydroxymethyldihydropteridine diphosphokinase
VGGEETTGVNQIQRIVLGLGANLGERGQTIERAITTIASWPGVNVVARSPLYVTPPAGGPPQPDYWNGAVLVLTSNDVRTLLGWALELERSLGRIRPDPVRWGPRTIDIDVLWAENQIIDEPGLTVPHPRLGERVFALRPLLDVLPDATDPRTGHAYATLAAANVPIVLVT